MSCPSIDLAPSAQHAFPLTYLLTHLHSHSFTCTLFSLSLFLYLFVSPSLLPSLTHTHLQRVRPSLVQLFWPFLFCPIPLSLSLSLYVHFLFPFLFILFAPLPFFLSFLCFFHRLSEFVQTGSRSNSHTSVQGSHMFAPNKPKALREVLPQKPSKQTHS